MRSFKKNALLISISIAIIIITIFIFFTGTINNCVSPKENTYTSYFSFNKNHESDYQAIYFSQSKGLFYGIYGKVDLDPSKTKVIGLHLKAVNYKRTFPFTYEIGFKSKNLPDSLLTNKENSPILHFNMVLNNLGSSYNYSYLKLKESIPIKKLNKFYVRRYFSYDDIGKEINDPCSRISTNHSAIGLNCVESDLKIIH